MRAKELWRLTPRLHTTTEPRRATAVPPESTEAEVQAKMLAAFERTRAERPAAHPDDGVRSPGDPRISANAAAFLVLERERLAVAARLSHPYRRRGDRYRDLILVTELIRVEYEHLARRGGDAAGTQSPTNGLGGVGDLPADWARPWGAGPMVEMGTAVAIYRSQRDRLARWLPTASRDGAAAAADVQLGRIISRFESAKGGRDLWPEPLPKSAPQRTWSWGSLRVPGRAAGVAVALATIGVGGILAATRGGDPVDTVSAPSQAVVAVPAAMAAVNERPHQPPSARGASDASKAVEHKAREARPLDQSALAASETPPPHPKPAPDVAPAPAATAAPPPPAPAPQPDPSPQPDPNPGPVSSLPPPVGSLPDPGDSGAGGG
jgi:hypothetical protein